MTTSQTSFLSEIISGEKIPAGRLAYFRARLSNKLHQLILVEFEKLSKAGKINKAKLARRIGKEPAQVTRLLGAPGNWTIDTFSDLALGMGCEPKINLSTFMEQQASLPTIEAPAKVGESVVMHRHGALAASQPDSSEPRRLGSALSPAYTTPQQRF